MRGNDMKDLHFKFWTPGHASADDSRTFGCAAHGYANDGVWREPGGSGSGIWRQALPGESLAGFMFGELVTLEGRLQFGNLMAVRLVPVKREA